MEGLTCNESLNLQGLKWKYPYNLEIRMSFYSTLMLLIFDRKLTCFMLHLNKDEDSNGSLEYNELKKCFEHLQLHLPEEEIEDLFHYCDIDGSKGIQFNEFIVLLCLIYLLEDPPSSDNVLGKTLIVLCFLDIESVLISFL